MLIAGLSGSIGMGKTTVSGFFADRNIPIFSADEAVHKLYEGPAIAPLGEVFPSAIVKGKVDRKLLGELLTREPALFSTLEEIIHPMVRDLEWYFIEEAHDQGAPFAVLEIPLLFETGADQLMDVTIVVSAGEEVQKERVLARPNMNLTKFNMILTQQMSDKEKQANADFVIDTGCSLEETKRAVDRLISRLKTYRAKGAYGRWKQLYQNPKSHI